MGELKLTTNDLTPCPQCGSLHSMMFQTPKGKWWVGCGASSNRCLPFKTKEHDELLDAMSEWGLKENA